MKTGAKAPVFFRPCFCGLQRLPMAHEIPFEVDKAAIVV